MKSKALLFGIAATMVSASALAYVAQELTLKFQHTKGEVTNYKLSGSIEALGQTIGITANVFEKVTDVAADGSWTVETGQKNMKISIGGQEQEQPTEEVSSETRNAKGELVKIKGTESETAMRTGVLSNFVLPSKAIKVGDTWDYNVKKDEKLGTVGAKVTYKLLAEEKFGGVDALKFKTTGTELDGSTPAAIDSTVWVDKASLKMLKVESKWTNVPIPGVGPVSGTMKLEIAK
jgi:hypothetical protein